MRRRPSLRQRLLVASVGICAAAALLIVGLVAVFTSVRREFFGRLRDSVEEQRAAESIMTGVYAQMLAAYRQVRDPGRIDVVRFDSLGQVVYERLREYLHQPMSLEAGLLVEEINEAHRAMEVDARVGIDLLGRGDVETSKRRIESMEQRAARLAASMDRFIALREGERSALYAAQEEWLRRSLAGLGIGIAGITAVGLFFVRAVHRKAVVPLAQVADAAVRLGQGDLDTRVPPQRHRELEDVATSFNDMAVRIRDANVARARSETLYRRLFNEAPIALYRTSPDGILLDANPAFVELLGYRSVDEVIGADVRRWYVHRHQREEFTARMGREGAVTNQTVELLRADGTPISVLDTTHRVYDPDTGAASNEGGLLDLTRIHRVEQELRTSVERFEEMAAHINEAFFIVEVPEFRTVYVSPTWATIWGRPLHEGYDPEIWFAAIHPDDRPVMSAAQAKVLEGEVSQITFRVQRPDGSMRWVRGRTFPVRNPAGAIHRIVGVSEDITELRQAEERFSQAQKMEAVGRLAGGVAHDFNNLLTVILATTEFIHADLSDDSPLNADLAEIRSASESAVALTRQLLAFSRKQIIEPVVFSLADSVAETAQMLRRMIGEHIALDVRIRADTKIRADRGQIQQVLTNLAVNARDAMPQGGTLVLETSVVEIQADDLELHPELSPGEYAVLSVADTGTGMTEEVRARAFEPFFTTKRVGEGTGLGLATCHGIIRQAGGTIDIYSELNVGTTFRIYIPRATGTEIRDTPAANAAISSGTETILMVEDEAAVRRVGARALRGLGYNVIEARDGVEAIRILGAFEGPVHLLLTDVVLPGLGGRELAQRIRALRPGIRVLFASGYTEDMALTEGLASQDVQLLQKPYTKALLAQKVRAAIDR